MRRAGGLSCPGPGIRDYAVTLRSGTLIRGGTRLFGQAQAGCPWSDSLPLTRSGDPGRSDAYGWPAIRLWIKRLWFKRLWFKQRAKQVRAESR